MRGSIKEDKRSKTPNTWILKVDLERGPNGERRQRKQRFRGTKKQGDEALNKLMQEVHQGTYVAPAKLTVRQYLTDWLADYVKPARGPKTYETYSDILRLYVYPTVGGVTLALLTPLRLQKLYGHLLESGGRNQTPLSPSTVRAVHRTLHKAFKQAIKVRLLASNPTEGTEPPAQERKKMNAYGAEDARQLLKKARRSNLYPAILLAVYGGLRRGEVLALRWDDVNLDTGMVQIEQSLEETRHLGLRLKETKSGMGRVVVLPASALPELRRYKEAQDSRRAALGDRWQESGLVFPNDDGTARTCAGLSRGFCRFIRGSGLKPLRFHDLRHTHATLLLEEGVHPKIVQERLGHASIKMTLDTYSHVLPHMQDKAAEILDGALTGRKRRNRD